MLRLLFKPIFFCIAAVVAVGGCVTTDVKKALKATDTGLISFPMEAYWKDEKINGLGTLALPANVSGKVPVVILAHGTKGVGYRENSWSEYLVKHGYATFALDYFAPRGVDGRGRNVPRPKEDVWGAISILSTHPRLDMDRVAVMGFSNGASVTSASASFDPKYDPMASCQKPTSCSMAAAIRR